MKGWDMREKDCDKCLWKEYCERHKERDVCEYFTFADDEEENDDFIERSRRKFHREWEEYVEE